MGHSTITNASVRAQLAIGRTINPGPGREQTARYFALIDAPLGGMRETARIMGEIAREDRALAAVPGRIRTTAAFLEAAE